MENDRPPHRSAALPGQVKSWAPQSHGACEAPGPQPSPRTENPFFLVYLYYQRKPTHLICPFQVTRVPPATPTMPQATQPPQEIEILERLQRTAQATGCSLQELLSGWRHHQLQRASSAREAQICL